MNVRTAWVVYSLLRLVFFAAPFAALYLMGWPWWLAGIVATLVAVSLSVIFLSKPRQEAARSIQRWRDQDRTSDDIVEDEAVDGAAQASITAGSPADADLMDTQQHPSTEEPPGSGG